MTQQAPSRPTLDAPALKASGPFTVGASLATAALAPASGRPRRSLAFVGAGAVVALLFHGARALAPNVGAEARLASLLGGAVAMLLIGSFVEWWVHGTLMHRRSRLPLLRLAYDLHHRAHHWTHYRPDRYRQDEVTYVPLIPPRPERACRTRGETLAAALGQALFYAAFAGPPVAAAWSLTGNAAFAAAFSAVALGIVGMAVHIHDAVHCPGHSLFERFGWFRWLDHHHYLHHVDTRANVNFLLPLGDLLLGTLRRGLTESEQARWPSFAQARATVHPSCARSASRPSPGPPPRARVPGRSVPH